MTVNGHATRSGLPTAFLVLVVWGIESLGLPVPPEVSVALGTVIGYAVRHYFPSPLPPSE